MKRSEMIEKLDKYIDQAFYGVPILPTDSLLSFIEEVMLPPMFDCHRNGETVDIDEMNFEGTFCWEPEELE